MKAVFVIGIILIVLGILSLFVAIPQTEDHSVRAGDVKFGVQTTEHKKVGPVVSGVLIAAGLGAMIAGSRR
jgi:uncharacterized membrane protein